MSDGKTHMRPKELYCFTGKSAKKSITYAKTFVGITKLHKMQDEIY